jgi:hypothetical protein
MNSSEKRMTLIYFVLLFTGLAFSSFGYRFNIIGFTISGVVWILITPFAVKSTVPYEVKKWSLLFLLTGGIIGTAAGLVLGDDIKQLVGLIGGAVIGGVGGWLLYGIFSDAITHLLFDAIFPKLSAIIMIGLFVLGAIWGAISLSDIVPRYFETVGGGLLIGGTIGSFSGILLGAEIIKRENE